MNDRSVRRQFSARLVAAALVLQAGAGTAAAQPGSAEGRALRDEGAVGVVALGGPRYAGSDEQRARLLPFISYRWANGWFASLENGVGYNFAGREDLQYGVRLTADFGRKEDASQALRGMGDVDAQPEVGVFYEQRWAAGVMLKGNWRHGSGNDQKGSLLELGAGYALPLGLPGRVILAVSVNVANQDYMQQYFGVDARQAVSSGYAPYAPQAGLRDLRAGVNLTHPLGPRWGMNAGLLAVRLGDEAAQSPLVRERNYLLGTLGMAYRF